MTQIQLVGEGMDGNRIGQENPVSTAILSRWYSVLKLPEHLRTKTSEGGLPVSAT